jgi:hypothetical protein
MLLYVPSCLPFKRFASSCIVVLGSSFSHEGPWNRDFPMADILIRSIRYISLIVLVVGTQLVQKWCRGDIRLPLTDDKKTKE